MNTNQHQPEEEQNLPDLLQHIQRKDGFSVPQGYFDRLPERIQEKALASTSPRSLFPRVLQVAAAATLTIFLVGSALWYFAPQQTVTITQEDLAELLVDEYNDYSESVLLSYLADEEAPRVESEEEAILEYLLEEEEMLPELFEENF